MPQQGGYSSHIISDEHYTYTIPNNLDMAGVAPLLCAGEPALKGLGGRLGGRGAAGLRPFPPEVYSQPFLLLARPTCTPDSATFPATRWG